ncbi:MAG: hypothetical protein WC462_03030 [archaeon]
MVIKKMIKKVTSASRIKSLAARTGLNPKQIVARANAVRREEDARRILNKLEALEKNAHDREKNFLKTVTLRTELIKIREVQKKIRSK